MVLSIVPIAYNYITTYAMRPQIEPVASDFSWILTGLAVVVVIVALVFAGLALFGEGKVKDKPQPEEPDLQKPASDETGEETAGLKETPAPAETAEPENIAKEESMPAPDTAAPWRPQFIIGVLLSPYNAISKAVRRKGGRETTASKEMQAPSQATSVNEPAKQTASLTTGTEAILPVTASATTFDISDLKISPTEAREGETVTISLVVTNTGYSSGCYKGELKINDELASTQELTLILGAIKMMTFAVVNTDPGEYRVKIGELEGRFTIPEANISVTRCDVKPQHAREGEEINIAADVTNSGGVTGFRVLELKLGDKIIATREVIVNPRTSQNVNFNITGLKPGFYQIELGNFMGSFMVEMAAQFETL